MGSRRLFLQGLPVWLVLAPGARSEPASAAIAVTGVAVVGGGPCGVPLQSGPCDAPEEPASFIELVLNREGDGFVARVRTDGAGRFEIRLPPGRYHLGLAADPLVLGLPPMLLELAPGQAAVSLRVQLQALRP